MIKLLGMVKFFRNCFICIILIVFSNSCSEELKPTVEAMEFRTWDFGVMLHFGLNTYTKTTGWQEVEKVIDGTFTSEYFTPMELDAREWGDIVSKSKAKYCVLTVKHHYGWCLWDSQFTDYDIGTSMASQYDIIGNFVDGCNQNKLIPGLYYSLLDYKHYFNGENNINSDYTQFVKNQIVELLTKYGPIKLLWFDTSQYCDPGQLKFWYEEIKKIQPACIVIFSGNSGYGDIAEYEGIKEPSSGNKVPGERSKSAFNRIGWWAYSDDIQLGYDRFNNDHPWNAGYLNEQINHYNKLNCNFLVGVPIGPSGKIPESGVEFLKEAGELINLEN